MGKPIDVESRPELAGLVDAVSESPGCTVLRRHGRDVAVIVPADAYQRLVREWETDFSVFDRIDRVMESTDPKALEQDIASAVAEVRRSRHRGQDYAKGGS